MTNDEGMTHDKASLRQQTRAWRFVIVAPFVIRHCFVIRHSSFVIPQ